MKVDKFLSLIPFLIVSKGNGDGPGCHNSDPGRINVARIIEAVIVAVIAGIVSGYISVQKLEVKLDALCQRTDRMERQIDNHIQQGPK